MHDLDERQMAAVKDGIAMYHQVKGAVKNGSSRRYGSTQLSYTSPEGWQAVVRTKDGGGEAFVIIHTFRNAPESITVPLSGSWKIGGTYLPVEAVASVEAGALTLRGIQAFNGMVIALSKELLSQ